MLNFRDKLCAFLEGAASAFDLSGLATPLPENEPVLNGTDAERLEHDADRVLSDFCRVLKEKEPQDH
jgi:hypothetical protein